MCDEAGPELTSQRQGDCALCIVDDDDAVRHAVALLLRTHGFILHTHDSALGLLVDRQIDTYGCLILDMHMPAMTGLEALEILRLRHVETPAIVLTGLADPVLADRLRAADAILLHKPVSEEQLLAAVTQACSGSRRSRPQDNT
jgi:FixJ family two-component response regulator